MPTSSPQGGPKLRVWFHPWAMLPGDCGPLSAMSYLPRQERAPKEAPRTLAEMTRPAHTQPGWRVLERRVKTGKRGPHASLGRSRHPGPREP